MAMNAPVHTPSRPSIHRDAVEHIARGEHTQALVLLKSALARLEGERSSDALGDYIFGSALVQRLSPHTAAECSLYLERFNVPQIRLFNLLASAVPFVAWTTPIANQHLLDHLADAAAPTVIDIGIGTGRQIEALLRLAARDAAPTRMTVIGVEPSDWSLRLAQERVVAAGAEVGIAVDFVAICSTAEALSEAGWAQIAQACTSAPVINASFALHHIADDGQAQDQRTDVLRKLHALRPRTLVLAEPNVDHHEPDLLRRFDNCWAHFSVAFSVIDALGLAPEDRDALKASFFGREIHDILGNPEALRTERHETTAAWMDRLESAGFQLRQPFSLPPLRPGSITAHAERGRVSLNHGPVTLVSLLAGVPAAHALPA